MSRFYCPRSGQMLCTAAGRTTARLGDFWAWHYYWLLECPHCGEPHPSLDYAEFIGSHPWQADPAVAGRRRWLSMEAHLVRYPSTRLPRLSAETLTDADIDATWSRNADTWEAGYDERGDPNRKYQSDPVLLVFLGDVAGQRLLDAGSGAGYLSRLLAKRGARTVAVEN